MKRITIILTIALILILCTGCSDSDKITLPLSAEEVENIELYRFVVPAQAEQKIVLEASDIQSIVDKLNSLQIKEEKAELFEGGETTSFRFNLNNGSVFEVIFTSLGEGLGGPIKFSTSTTKYVAVTNIGAVWDECSSAAIPIKESKLPIYDNPNVVDTKE